MAFIGANRRNLQIPPNFIPYLEQHRIYELFYDFGSLLGVNIPQDHILFLRNVLVHMNETRNRPNLILITPPYIDKKKLSENLASKTGQMIIKKSTLNLLPQEDNPKVIALKLFTYIVENDINKKGWILYDYPSNIDEGKALLRQGVLPTHTFLIIPSAQAYSPKELWIPNLNDLTVPEIASTWADYRMKVLDFRRIFKATLIEISVRFKSYESVLEDCLKQMKVFQKGFPETTPRVVLIGTRGSRRGKLAKLLADNLDLILVDMSELVEQASLLENEVGDQIRFLSRRGVPIYASIILKLLQERLLREDCLQKGWVLIRFPRDQADFIHLDSFDTPPNRVIFLAVNCTDSFERLKEIRINKFDGLPTTLTNIHLKEAIFDETSYFIHPSDDEKKILLEHAKYTSSVQGMLDYCGESCAIVNASGPIEDVMQRVLNIVVKTPPVAPPRRGMLKDVAVCPNDPVEHILDK